MLEFVDNHADEIFKLNAFGLLPEHVVRLILSRDALQADELVKYNGVYNWCEHYCRSFELTNIADVMRNFLDLIQFHKIPTNALLTQIYPSHIVPDNIFLSALAYQVSVSVGALYNIVILLYHLTIHLHEFIKTGGSEQVRASTHAIETHDSPKSCDI